jgi:GNAT superfamily N-acetyltransferase
MGGKALPVLETVPVTSRRDMDAFINLPWKIYKGSPYWVPPLKKEIGKLLDTSQHPFWQFSEQKLFIARRGSQVVGRIAGIIDRNFNIFHSTRSGAWGFFECVDDAEVSKALFEAVENWLSERGMKVIRGPLNPSTNYEVGLLVEGFDSVPSFMMPYNPPYYMNLVEAAGYRKEKDLLSFVGHRDTYRPPDWMMRLLERFHRDGRITIRSLDQNRVAEDMELTRKLYHECWAGNWGFVPMTEAEFAEMSDNLQRIGDPELLFFVYWDDEPVAVALTVPDINPLLKRLNGKMGLLGLVKILLYKKEVTGLRGLLFGVKEKFRAKGIPFVALDHALKTMLKANYTHIELGWNLEDNEDINQLETHFGASPSKRYRIYWKEPE